MLSVFFFKYSIAISICHQNNHTAHRDIGIDDVSEDAVGDALEHVGTKGSTDDDSTKSETVICQDGRSQETVVGTNEGCITSPQAWKNANIFGFSLA